MPTAGGRNHKGSSRERLTISLAPGQRAQLEALAVRNNAKLAFVVRYALSEFMTKYQDGQLRLSFPGQP